MKIQDELLDISSCESFGDYNRDLLRHAALKITYLEEVLRAVRTDDIKSYPFNDVRGENWVDARDRALKAGNNE